MLNLPHDAFWTVSFQRDDLEEVLDHAVASLEAAIPYLPEDMAIAAKERARRCKRWSERIARQRE